MTVGFSAANYLNKILGLLGGTAFTAPAAAALKLHVGDPGASGVNNPAAGSTTRVTITLGSPSGGAIAMTGTNPSWTNGGTTETLTHLSHWDATTLGNFLLSAALSSPQPWASSNTFTLTSYTITFTPVAA